MDEAKEAMKKEALGPSRTVGLDVHPDTFTAAFLVGDRAAEARVERVQDRVGIGRLGEWVEAYTGPQDVVVLEASANAFAVAQLIRGAGRQVVVLESARCAQIGRSYCANDRVDAVKLGRIWLSGLAQVVWQPDEKTRARREIFRAHEQVVVDCIRARQRLRALLNQHRIRLAKGFRLTLGSALERLGALHCWSSEQRLLLRHYHQGLVQAQARRQELRALMAADILEEPALLRLVQLCGLRHVTVYALGAFIGDIARFRTPKQLVAYVGVNPSTCQSGEGVGSGRLAHQGCPALRRLVVQAAKAILRSPSGAGLQRWGLKLKVYKGANRAAVAVARKLVTAVWYCLKGQFTPLLEVSPGVSAKLDRLISAAGLGKVQGLGASSRSEYRAQKVYVLKHSHELVFTPRRGPASDAKV